MVVMPDEMASMAPSRALTRYSSGVSDALTSTRLMIQSPNSASSRMPRNDVYSMWLWQLTKPGMMIARPRSENAAPGYSRHEARRGPDREDAPAGHGDAAVRQDGRGHREDPVGTVDRDVAVGFGHVATLQRAGAREAPAVGV